MFLKQRLALLMVLFVFFSLIYSVSICSAAEFNLKDFISQYEKAVVFVTTYDDKGRKMATGSGFFINSQGDFITNRHVIEGAVSASVETVGGEKYNLKRLLVIKPDLDLVLVSIENPRGPMPYLNIAENLPVKGEKVVVFGNPRGVKFTVSEGIVSGIQTFPNLEYPQFKEYKGTYVQFTAAVSGGSSGGPVLNEQGQVIAVTTWGFNPQISQNLNFAIPADNIRTLLAYEKTEVNPSNTSSEDVISEKKRVGFLVMYGPNLLNEIKKPEKRDEITALIEESIVTKFKQTQYNIILNKDAAPLLATYWKISNGFNTVPQMDDMDKTTLVEFSKKNNFDVLVFAGVELSQTKKSSNLAFAGSAVEVEMDLRVTNVQRGEYSYSEILLAQGSDSFMKFWGWEKPNMVKPVKEAVATTLRSFKRAFSADQIL